MRLGKNAYAEIVEYQGGYIVDVYSVNDGRKSKASNYVYRNSLNRAKRVSRQCFKELFK